MYVVLLLVIEVEKIHCRDYVLVISILSRESMIVKSVVHKVCGFSFSLEVIIVVSPFKLGADKTLSDKATAYKSVTIHSVSYFCPSVYTWWHWVHEKSVLAFIDTDDPSHQNRSPAWEPGPVCYSSCMTFFLEAATQDCTASTVIYSWLHWLATDVCNTDPVEINC